MAPAPKQKDLLSVLEAAKRLKVSPSSIRTWVSEGLLPSVTKYTPVTYVPASALEGFLTINCAWC